MTITQTRPRPTWSVTVFQRITSPFAVATHTDSKSGKCCIPITQPLPSSGRYPSDTSETELTACRIKMKKKTQKMLMAIVQQLLIVASKIIKGEFSKAELYGLLHCCT